jgi:hypothetical protein
MKIETVANKIRELDRRRNDPNRKKTRDERDREEQAEFQTYWSLAVGERSETSTLFSDEAKAANKVELARLRKKFAGDPRAKLADPIGFAQSHAEKVDVTYA